MARRQVQCINKTDRYSPWERIRRIGGAWGRREQPDAIRDIETGPHSYYVLRAGKEVEVIVAERSGNKYLKTEPDGEQPNNLLELPECT